MKIDKRKVLFVGDLSEVVLPERHDQMLEVYERPSGKSAAYLCHELGIEFVMMAHPLPDLALRDFATALRRGVSSQQMPQVLVIAANASPFSLEGFAHESFMFVGADVARQELTSKVMEFLGLERRLATRFFVELDVLVEAGRVARLCQTENISTSGILLRTSELFPKGTSLTLEIPVGEDESIAVEGLVVRHTDTKLESLTGVGVRFTHFQRGDRDRLRDYLREQGSE